MGSHEVDIEVILTPELADIANSIQWEGTQRVICVCVCEWCVVCVCVCVYGSTTRQGRVCVEGYVQGLINYRQEHIMTSQIKMTSLCALAIG